MGRVIVASASTDHGGERMTKMDGWAYLATRVPRQLHHRIRIYCVERESSIGEFVVAALREKLRGRARPAPRR
jgi:hypothetical protein